jgi:replication initiation protein RepC
VRREPPEKSRVLKLHPDELVRLAPRLKPYLRRPSPRWPEIVDAADGLRSDLDVSKPLWGEACLAMGREQAAIAITIVSTRAPGHFRTTAGGYFHGMVAKAKAGELNLDRTLWAMRRAAAEAAPQRDPQRERSDSELTMCHRGGIRRVTAGRAAASLDRMIFLPLR